ncbi:MAG: HYR domain-containing protein, partial [Flavobacteriales bacterium]
NNDDGQALDPSFAVDDISIAGDLGEDATPPVLTCPSDTIIYSEEYCYYLGDFESLVEVEDNLDFFPAIVQTPIVDTYVPPGQLTISITATDFSGNSSSCSLQLTVIDDDAPSIECPPSIFVEAPPGNTTTDVLVDLPLVEDNCSGVTITNSFNTSESASGAYTFGSTEVTYTATDEAGNISQCLVEVTVSQSVANCCLGDLNCDGAISVADLLILVSQFGCVVNGCFADL